MCFVSRKSKACSVCEQSLDDCNTGRPDEHDGTLGLRTDKALVNSEMATQTFSHGSGLLSKTFTTIVISQSYS